MFISNRFEEGNNCVCRTMRPGYFGRIEMRPLSTDTSRILALWNAAMSKTLSKIIGTDSHSAKHHQSCFRAVIHAKIEILTKTRYSRYDSISFLFVHLVCQSKFKKKIKETNSRENICKNVLPKIFHAEKSHSKIMFKRQNYNIITIKDEAVHTRSDNFGFVESDCKGFAFRVIEYLTLGKSFVVPRAGTSEEPKHNSPFTNPTGSQIHHTIYKLFSTVLKIGPANFFEQHICITTGSFRRWFVLCRIGRTSTEAISILKSPRILSTWGDSRDQIDILSLSFFSDIKNKSNGWQSDEKSSDFRKKERNEMV